MGQHCLICMLKVKVHGSIVSYIFVIPALGLHLIKAHGSVSCTAYCILSCVCRMVLWKCTDLTSTTVASLQVVKEYRDKALMGSVCSDPPTRHGFHNMTEVLLFTLFVSRDIDLGQTIILTARTSEGSVRLKCQLCFLLFNVYFLVGPHCRVTDV
jgi:hypothetical protein